MYFAAYSREFARRTDLALEGPERPPSHEWVDVDLDALGDATRVVEVAERMRGAPFVTNELARWASICAAAAGGLRDLARQRARQERSARGHGGGLDS
jgi:hypothetical protein